MRIGASREGKLSARLRHRDLSRLAGRRFTHPCRRDAFRLACGAEARPGTSIERQEKLVIIATGEDGVEQRRIDGERLARRRGQGNAIRIDVCREAGSPAQSFEIADEAVRYVHRPARVAGDLGGELGARLRQQVAGGEMLARGKARAPIRRRARARTLCTRPSAASPIVPVTAMRSPRPRVEARGHAAGSHRPDERDARR